MNWSFHAMRVAIRRPHPALRGLSAILSISTLFTVFAVSVASAHGDELNVNGDNKTCDIEFSANLTQDAFHRFTREIGDIVIHQRIGASVLPAGNTELGVAFVGTPIDQRSSAWNDTFTHPDGDHDLGDAIALPMVYGRVGLGRDLELGGYFTGNPDARYRLAGAGLKVHLRNANGRLPALAASVDYGLLFGPDDTTVNSAGSSLHASWAGKFFTTNASAGLTWSHAVERSPVVDLDDENTFTPQASVGVSRHLWSGLNLSASARFASVNTFGMRLGHTF